MVEIWVNRILAGDQKYEDCPDAIKGDVLAAMKKVVDSGILIIEDYERLTGVPFEKE